MITLWLLKTHGPVNLKPISHFIQIAVNKPKIMKRSVPKIAKNKRPPPPPPGDENQVIQNVLVVLNTV